jgi:hypothetical protein
VFDVVHSIVVLGQLGALYGKGDIFNSYQAQSSVLCSVQVHLFFLPSAVHSNLFSQCTASTSLSSVQRYVQDVRGGMFIGLISSLLFQLMHFITL